MRLQLPARIPVMKAFLLAALLALVELLQGTGPLYVVLVFSFLMLATFAFNIAGGFTRPSGAYIFFYATLTVIFGTVFKAFLNQAADTFLEVPIITISTYTATMAVMLVMAFLTRKVVTTRDGVAGLLHVPQLDLKTSSLGCFAVTFLINSAFSILPGGNGSILHAVAMINFFLPLGILLGTIAAVQDSHGTRSTSPFTIAAILYATVQGMLAFSKQQMFSPFVCWLMGMAWARYRLRLKHIITIIFACFLAQYFMDPLSNVGRFEVSSSAVRSPSALVLRYIEHPVKLWKENKARSSAYAGIGDWYFGKPSGVLDRLTMLAVDSQLISFTHQGHYFGYLPIYVYFENWVPHIIAPHKLEGVYVGGNRYAHEMGQLADADVSTGISYSPSAEAFHIDGWTGIFLLQPLIYLLVFVTADAVSGDARSQPWGLLPMLLFAHAAPEQLLGGSIQFVWIGNIGTIFCIFVCGYVTPVFGGLLQGRERTAVWRDNALLPGRELPQIREAV